VRGLLREPLLSGRPDLSRALAAARRAVAEALRSGAVSVSHLSRNSANGASSGPRVRTPSAVVGGAVAPGGIGGGGAGEGTSGGAVSAPVSAKDSNG